MKKIELIAVDMHFTMYSVVYSVKIAHNLRYTGVVVAHNNIKDKELILKPTIVDGSNMEVIFTPSNVTPLFYQNIFEGSNERFKGEYENEKNNIYKVGDVVGYILV